jgi:hypothetical protein
LSKYHFYLISVFAAPLSEAVFVPRRDTESAGSWRALNRIVVNKKERHFTKMRFRDPKKQEMKGENPRIKKILAKTNCQNCAQKWVEMLKLSSQ